MDENEEEWPTVGTPTATTDTSPNQSRAASPTKPSIIAQQDKVVAASIRPIRAAVPTSSRTPEIGIYGLAFRTCSFSRSTRDRKRCWCQQWSESRDKSWIEIDFGKYGMDGFCTRGE